jgi:hypothetical protein
LHLSEAVTGSATGIRTEFLHRRQDFAGLIATSLDGVCDSIAKVTSGTVKSRTTMLSHENPPQSE